MKPASGKIRSLVAVLLSLLPGLVSAQYGQLPTYPSNNWTPLPSYQPGALSNFDPYAAPQSTYSEQPPVTNSAIPYSSFDTAPNVLFSQPLIVSPRQVTSVSRLIQPMMGNSFVVTRPLEIGLNNFDSRNANPIFTEAAFRSEIIDGGFVAGVNALDTTNYGVILPTLQTVGIGYTVTGNADSAVAGGPAGEFTLDRLALQIPTPISLSLAGQLKASDNGMPVPADRVYVNRSVIYRQPVLTRITAGLEKTFGSGMFSIEGRLPLSLTFNPEIDLATAKDSESVTIGDVQLGFKSLLVKQQFYAISGGFFVSFPTGPGLSLTIPELPLFGTPRAKLFEIENESYHFMPYATYVAQLTPRLFFQAFAQYDLTVQGSPVSNFNFDSGGFGRTGEIKDPDFLHLDASFSYWFQNNSDSAYRGTAPTIEFHYSREFENTGTYRATVATQDNGAAPPVLVQREMDRRLIAAIPINGIKIVFPGNVPGLNARIFRFRAKTEGKVGVNARLTPPSVSALARRSGCFPALPYPPARFF